jgi:hypothetical protein
MDVSCFAGFTPPVATSQPYWAVMIGAPSRYGLCAETYPGTVETA